MLFTALVCARCTAPGCRGPAGGERERAHPPASPGSAAGNRSVGMRGAGWGGGEPRCAAELRGAGSVRAPILRGADPCAHPAEHPKGDLLVPPGPGPGGGFSLQAGALCAHPFAAAWFTPPPLPPLRR